MTDKLQHEFDKLMHDMQPQAVWRQTLQDAAGRMNDIAQGMLANPRKGSKMAGMLERVTKEHKAKLLADYKPFRAGGVNVTKTKVSSQLRASTADFEMIDDQENLDDLAKSAIVAQMVADPHRWLATTLNAEVHDGSTTH